MSNKIFIVFFLLCCNLSAKDFGIAMPGEVEDLYKDLDSKKENLATIPDHNEDIVTDGSESSPTLMDSVAEDNTIPSFRSKLLRSDAAEPYEYENRDDLLVIKNKEIIESIHDKGTFLFSFAYIMDQFDADDPNGIFQRTYERSTGSTRGGSLHFELDNVAYNGAFRILYGFSFGFGLSQGKASFATSPDEESNATFSLYTIPLDLRMAIDLIDTKNFKLSFAAGPSLMGLYQSRDDKEEDEDGKRIRQYSLGYFAQAKVKLGLGLFSERNAVSNFNTYGLTNMSINFETRFQSYENFQDSFSLTGASFGLGFSFEYL